MSGRRVDRRAVGRVAELWRFPVKSLAGQRLDRLDFTHHGAVGDRVYAVLDRASGLVITHNTCPELLLVAVIDAAHGAALLIPGAAAPIPVASSAPALGAFLHADVQILCATRESAASTDRSYDYGFPVRAGAQTFYDEPLSVHLISTRSLAWLSSSASLVDNRRTRANIVLDLEELDDGELVGSRASIGTATFEITGGTVRCELMDREHPGTPASPTSLERVQRQRDGVLGTYGRVIASGFLSVGDVVHLESA